MLKFVILAKMSEEPVEPPYITIWERLRDGYVVPFLGAGASLVGRPPKVRWSDSSSFPPTGAELAEVLATASSLPSIDPRDREDLAKVSSYYVQSSGRAVLRGKLRSVLRRDYPVGDLHRFLARVAKQRPLMIVTTNYDTLVERALEEERVSGYTLVVYDADSIAANNSLQVTEVAQDGAKMSRFVRSNKVDVDLKRTLVFKIHGSIDADAKMDSFVVTEEDYINFLSRFTRQTAIPSQFLDHFGNSSFLFLGYGLRDWNFRVVLNNLRQYLKESSGGKSWAIQRDVPKLEEILWRTREVNLYDMDLGDFARKLAAESRL